MKFSLSFLLAASAAIVSAQDFGDIPSCAKSCVTSAALSSGCSSPTDIKCLCTDGKDKVQETLTSCLSDSTCSASDLALVSSGVEKLCADNGVTVTDIPTAFTSGSSPTASATGGSSEETGAAMANVAGIGAVALGFAAAIGL